MWSVSRRNQTFRNINGDTAVVLREVKELHRMDLLHPRVYLLSMDLLSGFPETKSTFA